MLHLYDQIFFLLFLRCFLLPSLCEQEGTALFLLLGHLQVISVLL